MRIVKIEETIVVRTRIRAIACADATVVDLAIQPLGCVITGVCRTDWLAGCSIALLAGHRHEFHFHLGKLTFVITLDTNPMLGSSDCCLLFSYSRDIVFSMARDYAGFAACTAIKIDDHAP